MSFKVGVIDITLDLAPVTLIAVANKELPFLSCSAASSFEVVEGIDKALKEAEASVYCYLKNGSTRKILVPQEVQHTMDHGALYECKTHIQKAAFLFGSGNREVLLKDIERRQVVKNREALYQSIKALGHSVVVINLTDQRSGLDDLPYKVVKVFVPGIVPMNFGYATESLGSERIRSLPVKCGILKRPTKVELLNRFPHPFT